MPEYRFYYPIEVRYGDLDPQGHVNNAKYLTYLEQSRFAYLRNLGLARMDSFLDVGIILADIRVTYLAPILFTHQVRVGVRVSKIGNKSMVMDAHLVDAASGTELATSAAVLVAYDYHQSRSILVPDDWRQVISTYEGLPT